MKTGRRPLFGLVLAVFALLAGCGGGSDDAGSRILVSRVVVAGDSLADVGTFGPRFTVQNSADPANGFPVFPQIVAQNLGVNSQCNFFVFTGTSFAQNPRAGCTNFAIGGSRIQNPAAQGGAAGPQSIPLQLATAAQAVGGTYTATDLVLVDGGGNDAADLFRSLIGAPGALAYPAFLAQQLDQATIAATLPQPDGPGLAAVLYMRRLADAYYAAVKVNALDKGATHVAVLDMPDITLTPLIRSTLAQVAASAGSATAANVQAIMKQSTDAFNAQLRTDVGSDARVVVVPFSADFAEEMANPADFGLSNVDGAACQVVGVVFFGVTPADTPALCTSAALDARPPAGLPAGWWRSWAFADGFHPTPFGHGLLATFVSRALARAGWI